jgi:biopolymer transport protein ExbB
MMEATPSNASLLSLITSGGFTMYPLLICSLVVWGVIFERLWSFRRLGHDLKAFHLSALNALLRGDREQLRRTCEKERDLPTSRLLLVALERLSAKDARVRDRWVEAIDRQRQLVNQELRRNLWMLGTIGSAAPFIGLFGTVVGILQSFHAMARSGSGGFAVVAAGISDALIATAAGIVVAVIAVMAFNAFQTRWSGLVLMIRLHTEELVEMLAQTNQMTEPGARSVDGTHGHGA